MVRRDTDDLRKKYESIFGNVELKAQAFDKIAENYYFGNFGSMQKSDIDVLMFSIFIEGILDQTEEDINTYSDYTLAKQLGIPQSKVSTLKVKKQLQYPYAGFDWKRSFERMCGNARYESGKIRINLRDRNLYYELRNQIDERGGYVEATLTSNLLVISVPDFYDLVRTFMSDDEKKMLQEEIKKKYHEDSQFCEEFEKEPFGKTLQAKCGDVLIDVLCEVIKQIAPVPVGIGIDILRTACTALMRNKN